MPTAILSWLPCPPGVSWEIQRVWRLQMAKWFLVPELVVTVTMAAFQKEKKKKKFTFLSSCFFQT